MRHANTKTHFAMFTKTALALTVAGIGYPSVNAQTLDTVVVSASRSEQRSFDAPAAIQVVDRATIENAGP